ELERSWRGLPAISAGLPRQTLGPTLTQPGLVLWFAARGARGSTYRHAPQSRPGWAPPRPAGTNRYGPVRRPASNTRSRSAAAAVAPPRARHGAQRPYSTARRRSRQSIGL